MKFEYDITVEEIEEDPNKSMEERLKEAVAVLNERGAQGWELIQSDGIPMDTNKVALWRCWKRQVA